MGGSTDTRPALGLDLDGFLIAIYEEIAKWHDRAYGTHLYVLDGNLRLDPTIWTSVWLQDVWGGTPEQAGEKMKEFLAQFDMLACAPIFSALTMVAQLSRKYRLFLITANGTDRREAIEAWIEHYFPEMFEGILFTDTFPGGKLTKANALREIGAVGLLEDRVEYALQVAAEDFIAVVVDRYAWSFGEDTDRIRHVQDLLDVPDAVDALLAA